MAIKFGQVKEALFIVVAVLLAQSAAKAGPLLPGSIKTATGQQSDYCMVATDYCLVTTTDTIRSHRFQPVAFDFPRSSTPSSVLTTDVGKLRSSLRLALREGSIPQNTQLLSLKVQPKGVYINLSGEFLRGGGSSAMIERLTKVVYTATSLNPDASVYLSVDGQPLTEDTPIGGEGMSVRYPIDRQQLAQDFPKY